MCLTIGCLVHFEFKIGHGFDLVGYGLMFLGFTQFFVYVWSQIYQIKWIRKIPIISKECWNIVIKHCPRGIKGSFDAKIS